MPDTPKPKFPLAAAIRQVRLREGLTQEELAAKTGVHLTWISRIESGRYDIRMSSLDLIAGGLGTTVLELVALTERLELD